MSRVRVLVADDHPMYREGLVRAIKERPDLELVAQCADGRVALPEIRRLCPDVAVLDVRMPGLTGTEVLNAIARERIATRVVFLSAHVDSELVYRAVALGAAAYLSKEADRATIFDAVAAVARGQTVLSPEIQSGLAAQIQLRETERRPVLSPREQEGLRLIAAGGAPPPSPWPCARGCGSEEPQPRPDAPPLRGEPGAAGHLRARRPGERDQPE